MTLMPVGTVVRLEDAEKRLMIIGILQKNNDSKIYDYMGVPYPEGFLDGDNLFLFNHKDVADVSFLGYDDIERQAFIKKLAEEIEKI